jgi:folylpolyglutamate synthase/dihydropteroate synthase
MGAALTTAEAPAPLSAAGTAAAPFPAPPATAPVDASERAARAARGAAGTLDLLQQMQRAGLAWMGRVQSASQVAQAMGFYATLLGIDVSSIPPVIHIAGTKGKGSTAAMVEAGLRAAGLRTGL